MRAHARVDRAFEAEVNARVGSFLDHVIIAGHIQIIHLYDEIVREEAKEG